MAKFGVELDTSKNMSPVLESELKQSVYSLIKTLEVLYKSSQEMVGCSSSCGVVDWEDTADNHMLVEQSTVWQNIYPLWHYAEKGEAIGLCGNHEDVLGDLAKWLAVVQPIWDFDGERYEHHDAPMIKVVIKALARLKLELDCDLDDDEQFGSVTISAGWFPQVASQGLTILELALLAGVSNIRSVRNEQYHKDNPLVFTKKGKQVLVEVDVARTWLDKKARFIQTKGDPRTGFYLN